MPVSDKEEGVISLPEEVFFPADADEVTPKEAVTDEEGRIVMFDERHKLDFEGLLFLGHLTDTFVWMGHKFTIRTLTTNEYLEVALLHKQYQGTIGDIRCYTAAIVAACIERVDGKELPLPLERTARDNQLSYRYQYISEHWYPWIIDAVYERFQLLEARVEKVLEAMGKVSG